MGLWIRRTDPLGIPSPGTEMRDDGGPMSIVYNVPSLFTTLFFLQKQRLEFTITLSVVLNLTPPPQSNITLPVFH